MKPRFIIRLNGARDRFLGADLQDVNDRELALMDVYENVLAKAVKRFGANSWQAHATIEQVPYEEMFKIYGRIGGKSETGNKKRRKRPLQIMSGRIDKKLTYVCAHSLKHAIELLARLGIPLRYWQAYRILKVRQNFFFNIHMKPVVGVWRKHAGIWKKVL